MLDTRISQKINPRQDRLQTIWHSVNQRYFSGEVEARVAIDVPVVQDYAAPKKAHGVSPIPPASWDRHTRRITIHPYLIDRRAPRYVIEYLLHECGRRMSVMGVCGGEAEQGAPCPARDKAVKWLEEKGFPTLSELTS